MSVPWTEKKISEEDLSTYRCKGTTINNII